MRKKPWPLLVCVIPYDAVATIAVCHAPRAGTATLPPLHVKKEQTATMAHFSLFSKQRKEKLCCAFAFMGAVAKE
jgi:hypothetical protein